MKEALKLALEALENINNAMPFPVGSQAITAIKEALAQPEQEPKCKTHPDAPHGFVRNASHTQDRYVCECEYWEPPQPEQEPVAWGIIASNTGRICQVELDADEVEGHNPKHIAPLYTTPPQRTWVGLTDDDLEAAMDGMYNRWDIAEAIEAKLKEKNT